ncbi:MAG TPA: NAD(P)/FAD-dependent oxidoreductase [Thermoanaerobaculia bacterium]|nr:NAD(P)/FAD-dependent oxidoreductase [Thermoanaerobaculia bacterium]
MEADRTEPRRFDVVVVGGAIAGASTAILLRRWLPDLSVLVVEKGSAFDWKVGESTVEISSYFLTRVLKLYDYLSREQIAKQGFRYWFHHGGVTRLREASEVGPTQLARTPGFQLDRSRLDEHVLGVARAEGAEVWRPAKVTEIRLTEDTGAVENVVVVERDGRRSEIAAGWVVDASGRSAMIARKKGLLKPLDAHPTASIWARFRDVKDLDGKEVAGVDPADPFVRPVIAARRLATNHFVGFGYWIWFIPLKGGETSVGLVWDKRLIDPQGANPEEKLFRFLDGNPLTKEMLEKAEVVPGDTRFFGHLPYLNDRVVGDGWSMVGDAAGFLDPFYSPGLDQMAFSVSWTLELITRRGMTAPDAFAKELEDHNRRYARYLNFFFGSIYQEKYWLMGDYDTMTTSFLMDTALYYLAAVIPLYRWSADRVLVPPFYQDFSEVAFYPMRFYQRRLISIAKRKLALGIYGNHNAGRRPGLVGFSLRSSVWVMLGHGLVRWAKAEILNALWYVVRPKPMAERMPIQDRAGAVPRPSAGRAPEVPVRAA